MNMYQLHHLHHQYDMSSNAIDININNNAYISHKERRYEQQTETIETDSKRENYIEKEA